MTENNSHKKKARQLQRRTGMSYSRALREVSSDGFKPGNDADLGALVLSMLGIAETSSPDVTSLWSPSTASSETPIAMKPVPLGFSPDETVIQLDLNMDHLGDTAPHGIVIGTTGSGKSTLLHSVAFALCALHAPHLVQLVLIHGKISTAFNDFAKYPHVRAISSADRSASLLDELLTERRSAADNVLSPPHVVVIIDDSEALLREPKFADALSQLMLTGHSLGVHVLIASQSLPQGGSTPRIGKGAFRIALRTSTQQCSLDVIGTSEAAFIPTDQRGWGYYCSHTGQTPLRFQGLRTPRPLVVAVGDRLSKQAAASGGTA